MRTKRVNCQVYLEGIPVEFNSINIMESAGTPPRAVITFPADSEALNVLPKTTCHVFWLDDGDIDLGKEAPGFAAGTLDSKYRLIFQGELSGTSMMFTGTSREIGLTFSGFTQNWYNYPVLPMDVTPPLIAQHAVLCIKYPNPTKEGEPAAGGLINFANSVNATPLAILSTMLFNEKKQIKLNNGLRQILNKLQEDGLYLKKITRAFDLSNQTYIYDSAHISKLVQNAASIAYITKQLDNISGNTSVAQVIGQLLDLIGYEFCELAAPAYSSEFKHYQLRCIFLKPKTHFFSPLLCNAVFDDEIANLRFNRNYDVEPTRMISQNLPSFLSSAPGLNSVLIATVVPHDVVLAEELVKKGDRKDTNVLGLNQEELCRGIVLANAPDMTAIEEAYYTSLFLGQGPLEKIFENKSAEEIAKYMTEAVGDNGKKVLEWPTENETSKNFQMYQMNLANLKFLDQRHGPRTATLSTPFNPYRVVGLPGLVVTKYFTTLIGTLQQISTSISSDGAASQSLVFSHVRAFNIKNTKTDASKTDGKKIYAPTSKFAFMDDDFKKTPEYYEDFSGKNLNEFYKEITGYTDSSLLRFHSTDINLAIQKLKQKYEESQKTSTTHVFITDVTKRKLASKKETFSVGNWGKEPRTITGIKTPIGISQEALFVESPWIKERQTRVKEVFDVTDDNLTILNEVDDKNGKTK